MKKKAVKKKLAPKKGPKIPTLMDKLPKNEGEHLELMIRLTERAINPSHPDKGMVDQAERLKAKLAAWKSENTK